MGIGFAIAAWIVLVVNNSDLLYLAQDMNFWQPGLQYLNDVLVLPGSIFSWAGQYLTQFFYYPALGASILIAGWLIIYALLQWGTKLPWYMCWLPLLLPALLMLYLVTPGYWAFLIKAPDWWFTPTLFALFMALLMAALRWVQKPVRIALQVSIVAIGLGAGYQWMDKCGVPPSKQWPSTAGIDDNYHTELQLYQAVEECRWSDADRLLRQAKQPTREIWLYRTVVLLNTGKLSTDFLSYPCMTSVPTISDDLYYHIVRSSGPLLYFYQGSVQFAYRWCMENMVEYGPSMRGLRLMVRCALVKGETELARKYIDILSQTSCWHDWAEGQRRLLNNPSLLAEQPDYKTAMLLSPDIPNILDGDEGLIESYLTTFYPSITLTDNIELSRLVLAYTLQKQNIKEFWPQFFAFVRLNGSKPMPRLYQEAALLYGQLEPQTFDSSQLPFSDEVKQSYARFSEATQRLLARGRSEKQIAQDTQREFGKTFFWFYYFCRNFGTY